MMGISEAALLLCIYGEGTDVPGERIFPTVDSAIAYLTGRSSRLYGKKENIADYGTECVELFREIETIAKRRRALL